MLMPVVICYMASKNGIHKMMFKALRSKLYPIRSVKRDTVIFCQRIEDRISDEMWVEFGLPICDKLKRGIFRSIRNRDESQP